MNIVVIGASGLIGGRIYERCVKKGITVLGTSTCEGTGFIRYRIGEDSVDKLLSAVGSLEADDTYVVVSAAVTDISTCEKDPGGTFQVNVTGTLELVRRISENGAMCVFLSSDAVFDGMKGAYSETDDVRPVNEYGRQKAMVEEKALSYHGVAVYRLSKQYDTTIAKRHLVSDMWRDVTQRGTIRCIAGMRFNPTYVGDTADIILEGCRKKLVGLYHMANPVSMQRYDFAMEMVEAWGIPRTKVTKEPLEAFGLHGERALDTSLNTEKMRSVIQHDFLDMESLKSEVTRFVK